MTTVRTGQKSKQANDIKGYLEAALKQVKEIKKIRGEASTRMFFRVFFENRSQVAMVYPGENPTEIDRIVRLTDIYREHGIQVPGITDVIDSRIILQQDLGDMLVQKAFNNASAGEREEILTEVADILTRLKRIAPSHTGAVLDTARMKWEMDFFHTHFAANYLPAARESSGDFQQRLHRMVDRIRPIDTFAHRDFHSRNMLMHQGGIFLVDFQDSLVASPYYDVVSIAYDSYLDLGARRRYFMRRLEERGMVIDDGQLYLSALQRNIKALGTFGYQVTVRRNLSYKRYIARTLRHVLSNPLFGRFFLPGHFAAGGRI
jgi:aminoglycoside/choline kinase family phosphotransferase